MKILYFFEPWIWKNAPNVGFGNCVDQFGSKQIKALQEYEKCNFEIHCIYGDSANNASVRNKRSLPESVKTHIITQAELKLIFPNYLDATLKWNSHNYSDDEMQNMVELIQKKLNEYTPDIIITFLTPAPYLKKAFPKALHFYTEYGIFSRPPYPESYYFDPCGYFQNSFFCQFFDKIKETKINLIESSFLRLMRYSFKRKFRKYKKIKFPDNFYTFEKKILLPLQFDNHFVFNGYSTYLDQFDFLCDVLNRIDPNIGVIVTEHNYWGKVITDKNIQYLQETYPNLIIDPQTNFDKAPSQAFLLHVDGVVSLTSTVALQAMLWQKAIFGISSPNSHISILSETTKIEEIGDILHSKQLLYNKDNVLYYLLTHYYQLSSYCFNKNFFPDFLIKSYKKYQDSELNFKFFEKIDIDIKIFKEIIKNIKNI